MAKPFLDDNFMLHNATAEALYHDFAAAMPIIDYHCHLNPQEIWENKRYKNITELWLYGDHYKWRAMRANGCDESVITGGASDYDKFLAYAETVPMTIGNPLYHWTHLELKRYFGVDELLNGKTAPAIWENVNAMLAGDGFRARDFIVKSNVKVVCTTDDPADSLEYHRLIKADPTFDVAVYPAFRPDQVIGVQLPTYPSYVAKLGAAAGLDIRSYDDLLAALETRIDFFHANDCRVSDHGLDYVPYAAATKDEASAIFAKAMAGGAISFQEEQQFKTFTLVFLGKLYAARGWVMQYHMNALRNNNTRAFETLGRDTGFDSINDASLAQPLARLLDAIESEGGLPKTILYSLNPVQNHIIGAMIGNFQGGGIPGKIQFGSGWWFNDTKEGMIAQMKALAELGLLSRFVGMLTDSRSFLSYTRHEYFRRILCNLLGEWVEAGEFPDDRELLGDIVRNICYENANNYFPFPIE